MAAIERLENAKSRIAMVASSVGFYILQKNFKLNLLSYFTIFDVITYLIINAYDIKMFWGDLLRVCFCLVTWTYGYQGAIRIIIFASKAKFLRELYDVVYQFMMKMEKQMETNHVVRKFAAFIDVQSKFIMILFYTCGILTVTYPVMVFIYNRELILPFGFVIPGVSDTKQPGYVINYLHHILQVILTIGGLTASHCIILSYLNGACLMIEVLIIKLKQIGKVLCNYDAANVDGEYKDVDLTEIIQRHQEILEFVKIIESVFSVMFLVDVVSVTFQISITLLVCSTTFWIPGFVIIVTSTTILFIECGYGLYIEIKFDALNEAVYDLPWHLMSIKDRKTILFMLARTQKPPLLTFGKMAYINMAAFIKVYKSIYSYFMMLKSFEV